MTIVSTTHTSSKPKNSCNEGDYGIGSRIRPSTHSSCSKPWRISNKHGKSPVRSRAIKDRYESVAESHAVDPLTTLKSIQNHLSDLHMLGFLQRRDRNHGEGGGRYYEYQLDLDPEIVIEVR